MLRELQTPFAFLVLITLLLLEPTYPVGLADPSILPGSDSNFVDLPLLDMNQTAEIRILFQGINETSVDEFVIRAALPRCCSQFHSESSINWSLDYSLSFMNFPSEIAHDLSSNSYEIDGMLYLNSTLLDEHMSSLSEIPAGGYLLSFMCLPSFLNNHSWFYVDQKPDSLLGRIDFFGNTITKIWECTSKFGGLSRAVFFDISSIVYGGITKSALTSTVIDSLKASIPGMFPDLLGAEESEMIEADRQMYENYFIDALILAESDCSLRFEGLTQSFVRLMPWTTWNLSIRYQDVDAQLSNLISSRTLSPYGPLNYTWRFPNGTHESIICDSNVVWDWTENDPINEYLFGKLEDYFPGANLDDMSKIQVAMLILPENTSFGGTPGIGAGVCWFSHGIVIMGVHRSVVYNMDEVGPIYLTNLLRHEIGHWLSLSHHATAGSTFPKTLCSMSAVCSDFCSYCRDARARMSYLSYFNFTRLLLMRSESVSDSILVDFAQSIESFYNWNYTVAIQSLVDIRHQIEQNAQAALLLWQILTGSLPIFVIAFVAFVMVRRGKAKEVDI
ncbi:MAG: hypothetical protein EAX95_04855 [Candidatus Thorarchaeota archaeon]|nr:hypothetical protein [Candidatus Thorarchaeota archaeon]